MSDIFLLAITFLCKKNLSNLSNYLRHEDIVKYMLETRLVDVKISKLHVVNKKVKCILLFCL